MLLVIHERREFITGYTVEKALAIGNIFVFLMLFTHFAVTAEFQTRAICPGKTSTRSG